MVAGSTFGILVTLYQTAWFNNPEDCYFHLHDCENLKSDYALVVEYWVSSVIYSSYAVQESETFILETFSTENLSLFVRESLNDMLERTSTARQNVGKLMSQLVKADVITISVYLSG